MVYWFFCISASGTTYISLYLSHFQFFLIALHPDIHFQQNAFNISIAGPKTTGDFFIRVNAFYLVFWFDRIFSIISEMPFIPVCHLSPAQWYGIYDFYILGIHQSPNHQQVPTSRSWIDKRVHCKIWVNVMLISGEWLGAMYHSIRI